MLAGLISLIDDAISTYTRLVQGDREAAVFPSLLDVEQAAAELTEQVGRLSEDDLRWIRDESATGGRDADGATGGARESGSGGGTASGPDASHDTGGSPSTGGEQSVGTAGAAAMASDASGTDDESPDGDAGAVRRTGRVMTNAPRSRSAAQPACCARGRSCATRRFRTAKPAACICSGSNHRTRTKRSSRRPRTGSRRAWTRRAARSCFGSGPMTRRATASGNGTRTATPSGSSSGPEGPFRVATPIGPTGCPTARRPARRWAAAARAAGAAARAAGAATRAAAG